MEIYLRIAEYYLQLREVGEAEAYVNRASLLQPDCHDQHLLLRYKVCHYNSIVLVSRSIIVI